MYCSKCGSQLEKEARFCSNCGARVIVNVQSENMELVDAVQKLKQGDEQGFDILYLNTYNYVYSRARYILGDKDEALDLVQEVYLALFRNINSLKEDGKIYSWMGAVTFRQAMKILRKNNRQVLLSEEKEGMFEELEDNGITPEEGIMDTQDAKVIRDCIDNLSAEQKAVVLAYYYDGLKIEEIAEITETSEGTVKSRLYLARKYLRKSIIDQEEKQGYRLHSFGVPIIVLAIKEILSDTMLSNEQAQTVYGEICGQLGIAIGEMTAENAISTAVDKALEGSHTNKSLWRKIVNLGKTKIAAAIIGTAVVGAGTVGVLRLNSQDNAVETEAVVNGQVVVSGEIQPTEVFAESEIVEETVPEPVIEVPDYILDYRETYKNIVSDTYDMYGMYVNYGLYDMDGDGIWELFVCDGNNQFDRGWNIYSYDIRNGEAYLLGRIARPWVSWYRADDGTSSVIAVSGYQAVQDVFELKMNSSKELQIETFIENDALEIGEGFYSTQYPMQVRRGDDLGVFDYLRGESTNYSTGVIDKNGREILQISNINLVATSVLQEDVDNYNVQNLNGNPATCWAEGVEGNGEGEALIFFSDSEIPVDGFAILPGFFKNSDLFEKNGYPVKVTVKYNDKIISKEFADFKPDFENPMNSMVYVDFGERALIDKCTVVISGVASGTKYEDTCISEAFLYTFGESDTTEYENQRKEDAKSKEVIFGREVDISSEAQALSYLCQYFAYSGSGYDEDYTSFISTGMRKYNGMKEEGYQFEIHNVENSLNYYIITKDGEIWRDGTCLYTLDERKNLSGKIEETIVLGHEVCINNMFQAASYFGQYIEYEDVSLYEINFRGMSDEGFCFQFFAGPDVSSISYAVSSNGEIYRYHLYGADPMFVPEKE